MLLCGFTSITRLSASEELRMFSRARKHYKIRIRQDLVLSSSTRGFRVHRFGYDYIVDPMKLETGLRPNGAGIPYTLLGGPFDLVSLLSIP